MASDHLFVRNGLLAAPGFQRCSERMDRRTPNVTEPCVKAEVGLRSQLSGICGRESEISDRTNIHFQNSVRELSPSYS